MARASILAALSLALLAACQGGGAATVDQARIEGADSEPGNWLSYGRDYLEQHYSPLDQVNTENVGQLGLAWAYETREGRGAEATPIVVDGVMYVTSAWSVVYALDAATGRELWVHDPVVDRSVGAWGCCDMVNRGVAVWKGRVYVATVDGRLVAIDAKSGAKVWDVVTFDKSKAYTSTGAPRIAKGLVFIGNAGGEYGVRGYISAFDAETGKLKWRFYTVPGDPSKGPDGAASDPQMAMATKTWTGEWWKYGGGGTVWDAIVYDPELDQLYFGVGNGSPWDRKVRSPGGGDNLFLSSIVAVKPETGEYLWHFQETPGETWDYTATQPIVLATLKLGGQPRKVLMHAPKNGFFYVLDRASGKFISGKNIIPMAKAADTPKGMPISWAYGLDAHGRPLENPEARYMDRPALVTPSGLGAHNWQPMSYSPQTGLIYIPVRRTFGPYESIARFEYREKLQNTGNASTPSFGRGSAVPEPLRKAPRGELLAWDPVAQKPVWSVPSQFVKNGGTLATAGGLVFWPEANGTFAAFDARSGRKLWSSDAGMSMVGPPVSYAVDGVQYLAVMTGAAFGAPVRISGLMPKSRVLVYRLGGKAALPPYPAPAPIPAPPVVVGDVAMRTKGAAAYAEFCAPCHGGEADGMSVVPDLRRSPVIQHAETFQAVLSGALADRGMPNFGKWIPARDAEAIRAHIAAKASETRSRK